MEIVHLTESIIEYLLISSALLFILGLLSFVWIQSLKVQGKAKLLVCTLIILLPLTYPLKSLFPESVKVPVRLEMEYFQKHVSDKNGETVPAGLYVSTRRIGIESRPVDNEISTPVIKEHLKVSVAFLTGNWKQVALAVWGGVFLFFLIRLFLTGVNTNKFLRMAVPVTDRETLKLLQQCAFETGLQKPPKLLVIEGLATPVVMGILKPAVIIPGHILRTEFHEGLRFTLLHELKHLQQRHNWWLLIESIIGAAYFFHPIFHWAKNKIHEEMENVCDRHVTHITDKSVSYADFLLNQIWQHRAERGPALVLSFISTKSKTATRIHSILENTRQTAFMHIRDRASVFMVLTVFPLILLLSIAPAVPDSDRALNMLSPLHSQKDNKNRMEPVKREKEISVALNVIEKSPGESSDGNSSPVMRNIETVSVPADNESPIKIFAKKTVPEPVREAKKTSISLNDKVVVTEKKQEISEEDNIALLNIIGNINSSNMPWVQNDTETSEMPDESISTISLAGKYLGKPVKEVSISHIYNIKVLDEYTVLFIMRGGDIYLTRLFDPCPGLLHANDFNIVSNSGRLSRFDRIQAISFGQIIGTTGMLGPIYPYKYEGNKYDAIKLLKKSLLTDLVAEGAFKV